MKISVLTPTYNRANLLDKLYVSIKKNCENCSNMQIEWLVMDDGSTDNTKDVVKKYVGEKNLEVKYFYQRNQGKMKAINNLIEKSTGDFILECDSDDYLTDNACNIIDESIKKYGNIERIYALVFLKYTTTGQNMGNNFSKDGYRSKMYDLYFNWKFVWVKAGLASLTTNATTYHSQPAYRINLLALGSKRADFFFKMRDTLTCVIGEKLEPRYFRKGAEEGKRYTVDEAWFSYKDGLCLVNQKRTYRDGAFDESEASDSRCIYDMLSILAQARSYDPADYKVGDKIKFPMATGRKVEEQTLIYRGKENVKAENGVTYRCLIFSLVEYDKKGKEKEVITFFVTDDLNHLPVRLDLFLNFGSAKAFLNNVTGNRHPLTSIVK